MQPIGVSEVLRRFAGQGAPSAPQMHTWSAWNYGSLIDGSDVNLIVLTGAGISAESGLATFRAADGLWADESIDAVCTPEALARDPSRFASSTISENR